MFQDKLGVYRVGDLKFHSKLEAIEMHAKTGIHPHWDFNEAVFSSYDWTVEPTENILELYRQRAQQLRDKYDYIVLFWSGGSDSETVLQSFVDNDIKLDEIATYSNYEATGDRKDFLNAEVFEVSMPRAAQLKELYPWMKHRVIDISQQTIDVFAENKLDWIYNMNMFFTPNCVAKDGLYLKIKEWRDIIESGKKFCILWGHDKPRIIHENNRFSFRFMDLIDNGPNVKGIAGTNPYTDELFFWTPDMPKIVIKQSHLIKSYLNANLSTSPFVSFVKSDLAYKTVNGKKHWLSNHGVHSVIYPNWPIDTFSVGKPPSIIASPRDTWFVTSEESNTSRRIWQTGVDKLFKMLPDYWKNNPADIMAGLKACISKDYYLE
jgi:hypothetical protein